MTAVLLCISPNRPQRLNCFSLRSRNWASQSYFIVEDFACCLSTLLSVCVKKFSSKAFPTVMMTEVNQRTSELHHNEEKLPPTTTQHTDRAKSDGHALIISYDNTSP